MLKNLLTRPDVYKARTDLSHPSHSQHWQALFDLHRKICALEDTGGQPCAFTVRVNSDEAVQLGMLFVKKRLLFDEGDIPTNRLLHQSA